MNSRYYNPKLGRFVTMDEVKYLGVSESLLSYNLYSYCENNPVNKIDENGNYSKTVLFDRSWLFELSYIFGINISDSNLNTTLKKSSLLKIYIL